MATAIRKNLIACCGMNCAICRAYLREKNPCHGCRDAGLNKPPTRFHCNLRLCEKRTGAYCFDCTDFPCNRLKHLDKRYRTRYGMSEIENLEYIRDKGVRKFLIRERERWISEKGIFCVHDRKFYSCK